MLVSIDVDVLDINELFRTLDELLIMFEKDQHELYIEADEYKLFIESEWVKGLSGSHQSIVHLIVEKSAVRSKSVSKKEKELRGITKISRDSEVGISLNDSMKYLKEPLLLIVENNTSDKLFIKRLFSVYTKPGSLLHDLYNKKFIDFYPAGGKTQIIPTLIDLSARKSEPYYPRLFVIIDSDLKIIYEFHLYSQNV